MFTPEPDSIMTVALPHETTRAQVKEVVSRNMVIVALNQARPMNKDHGYKYEDYVEVRRGQSMVPGVDVWSAVRTVPKPVKKPVVEEAPKGRRREVKAK